MRRRRNLGDPGRAGPSAQRITAPRESPARQRLTTSYEVRVNPAPGTSRDGPHGDRLKDVGTYEFRVRRTHRQTTPDHAIRRARELAFADGVTVFGDPVVNSRRVPIPVIGPKREFVVTFPRATRRGDRSQRVADPLTLDQERDLPDLHSVVDEVDEVG